MGIMGAILTVCAGAYAIYHFFIKKNSNSGDSKPASNSEYYGLELYRLQMLIDAERRVSRNAVESKFVVISFPDYYFPSSQIEKASESDFSYDALATINSEIALGSKLCTTNVHKILKTLLAIEDFVTLKPYSALCQSYVTVYQSIKNVYWIQSKNPNCKNIITSGADEVVIIPNGTLSMNNKSIDILNAKCTDVIGVVEKVEGQRVYFELNDRQDATLQRWMASGKNHFDVVIRPNRMPMRYQYKALDMLAQSTAIREYIFPTHSYTFDAGAKCSINLSNTAIYSNPEQLQAVQNIVDGTSLHAPYIIFGPPGTGKTATITEAILQLQQKSANNRILVAAGSNSACDTIALRLCQYYQKYAREYALVRLYSVAALKSRRHVDPLLKQYSNYNFKVDLPIVEELRRYGIIVATLSQVGKLVSGDIGKGAHFTHVFIDEAGASTEPETLVGIMGIKSSNCRIILSGDHKQLGPVLKSKRAASLGLQQSMLERLMARDCYAVDGRGNYNRTCQIRLRRNYRSHPQIVRLYNHLYYNDELLAENKADKFNCLFNNISIDRQFPIIFQAVRGICAVNEKTCSSYNEAETDMVMTYVKNIRNGIVNGEKVDEEEIGIISPYKEQCWRIQNKLNENGLKKIEVGSVEVFQGREKQIIIASLVRSDSGLGFVGEPRRLNVMLSRPKSLLIFIGNPHTLRRNLDFKYVIEQCEKHKTLKRIPKSEKENKLVKCHTNNLNNDTPQNKTSKRKNKRKNVKNVQK